MIILVTLPHSVHHNSLISKDVNLNQLTLADLINYLSKYRPVNPNRLVLAKTATYSTSDVCYCVLL